MEGGVTVSVGGQRLDLTPPKEVWLREALAIALGEGGDSTQMFLQCQAAAIFLCAASSKGPRYCYDMRRYGAECMAYLRNAGASVAEISEAGAKALDLILQSLPTAEDIEEAQGN